MRLATNMRNFAMHNHVATRAIDFISKRERDRQWRRGFGKIAIKCDNARDSGSLATRQHHDGVAWFHATASKRACEAAKVKIRSIDPLHRKAEINHVASTSKWHGVKVFEQRHAVIPRRLSARVHNIVALER